MDHLKWDSGICDEYIASLRRMNQHLDEEIQRLATARKKLLRQSVTTEDQALAIILDRMEKVMKNLQLANDRIHELREGLSFASEAFDSAERRVSGMGVDLLYSSIAYAAQRNGSSPLFTTYTNAFRMNEITPEWLSAITQEGVVHLA